MVTQECPMDLIDQMVRVEDREDLTRRLASGFCFRACPCRSASDRIHVFEVDLRQRNPAGLPWQVVDHANSVISRTAKVKTASGAI